MANEKTGKIASFNRQSGGLASYYVGEAAKKEIRRKASESLAARMVRRIKRLLAPHKEVLNPYFQAEIEHAAHKLIEGMRDYITMSLKVDEILQTPDHPREQVLEIEAERHALHLQLVELANQIAISQNELNTLIQLQLQDAFSQKVSTEISTKISRQIGFTVNLEDDDLKYVISPAHKHQSDALRLVTQDEKPGTYSLLARVIYRPRDSSFTPFMASLIDDEPIFTNQLLIDIKRIFSQLAQNHPELQAQCSQFSSHYCHDHEYFPGDDSAALQLITTKLTFPKKKLSEIEKILKKSSPFIS